MISSTFELGSAPPSGWPGWISTVPYDSAAHPGSEGTFNRTVEAWGAHVAVLVGDRLLHLCAEVGVPALWTWDEFGPRERYAHLVGIVRIPNTATTERSLAGMRVRAPRAPVVPSE